MKKGFLPLFVLPFLLLTASCGIFSERTIVLTEKDSGRTISVKTGDYIEVHLNANPTTGYLWSSNTPNDSVLRLLSDKYVRTETGKDLVGAPSVKIFIYGVVGPGETGIKLQYRRPWEKDKAPEQTFDVLIRATGESSFREPDDSNAPVRRVGSQGQVEYR